MKRAQIFMFLAVVTLSITGTASSKAQGWETLAAVFGTQLLKELDNGKLKVPVTIYKHTNWCAQYADGTRVYNEYRSYRTPETILGYLAGTHTASWDKPNGDVYWYRGSAEAQSHVKRHGKIVQLYYWKNGSWNSVL